MTDLKSKIARVGERMDRAAQKTGRSLKDIVLVAVTKGVKPEFIQEAIALGLSVFGENRVQEAQDKIATFGGVEWHMIGHLQTNKVKPALALFRMIQSVDSVRVARAIGDEAVLNQKVMPVLLEVNLSGEAQKYGFRSEEIYGACDAIAEMPGLRIEGLMGIAPGDPDEAKKREVFKKLKCIFNVVKGLKKSNFEMRHLSMGMSDDFEMAIEEGSNMVRLGKALFA
jgi:pyridoxal phosphate enzyme (YggS family)